MKFELNDKNVLIISPEPWGDNLLSKHHYALELSKKNKVYFLNSAGDSSLRKLIQIKKLENQNIFEIKYFPLVRGMNIFPLWLIKWFDRFQSLLIKKRIGKIDLVWSFDQFRFLNLKLFQAKKTIFHPLDVIDRADNKKDLIAESADITLSVTRIVLDELDNKHKKYFLNHAVDELFFNNNSLTEVKSKEAKINVGYVGNLCMNYIDWASLSEIVTKFSNVNFEFIGPYEASNLGKSKKPKELTSIEKLKNVALLGEKPKKEITRLLSKYDILLLCYDGDKYMRQVSNSHKIMEYLSTGKVVVANYTYSYDGNEEILEMVDKKGNLVEKFEEVLNNLDFYNANEKRMHRIEFAKRHTYSEQLSHVESLLNQLKNVS